jgi:RNA polymerase sigma factor (sigma-70 family)
MKAITDRRIMMQTEDGQIISQCLNGDSAMFGFLVEKYKQGVYAFAYSKLGNFHDAQDITQETFIKAFQKIHTLKRYDAFALWLSAIANNLCKNFIRSKLKRPDKEFAEDQSPDIVDNSSVDSYRDDLINESLQEALNSLPEVYRQVLMLHYFSGYKNMDIAHLLGISLRTVAERLHIGKERLREEMITMMSETFKEHKLSVGFTFRIVEIVKRIKINPVSHIKGLPWGLSLATGIIIAVLSLNPYMPQLDQFGTISGAPLLSESKVLKVGEIPVDVVKTSNVPILSSRIDKGKNGGPKQPDMQNALFMAPQAEGGTWANKVEMSHVRHLHSASVVDGKIYVFGGFDNASITPTVEEYDPILDKWTYKKNMPTLRYGHTATTVNGKIYIIGGSNNFGASTIATVEEYNPKTDSWKEKADMPSSKYFHSAAVLHNKIYIIGGKVTNGIASSSICVYDPLIDQWEQKKDIPDEFQMDGSPAIADGNNIYILGGYNNKNWGYIDKVLVYNTLKEEWVKKAEIPTKRYVPTAAIIGRDIYVIGGVNVNANPFSCFSVVEKYNIDEDKWEAKTDMPSKRSYFGGSEAPVIDNQIYIVGGVIDVWENTTTKNEVYTPDGINFPVSPQGKLPTKWGKLRR